MTIKTVPRIEANFFFAIFLVFTVYILPHVQFSNYLIRPEMILVPLGIIFIMISKIPINLSGMPIALLSFAIPVMLSNFRAFFVLGGSLQDMNQILRVALYAGFYILFGTFIAKDSSNRKRQLLMAIVWFSSIHSVIIIIQYFNIGNLNQYYIRYTAPTQWQTVLEEHQYIRPSGMSSNPNTAAAMIALGGLCTVSQLSRGLPKKRLLIYLAIQIVGMLMTGSRSGQMLFLSGTVFISLKSYKGLMKLILVLAAAWIAINIWAQQLEPLLGRWIYYLKTGETGNSGVLFRLLLTAEGGHIQAFLDNWFLGTGPQASVQTNRIVDSEWLWLLRTYGVFGTIWLILTFSMTFYLHSREMKNLEIRRHFRLFGAVSIGCVLVMIPASVFSNYSIMPIILAIAAISLEPGDSNKNENHENSLPDNRLPMGS